MNTETALYIYAWVCVCVCVCVCLCVCVCVCVCVTVIRIINETIKSEDNKRMRAYVKTMCRFN